MNIWGKVKMGQQRGRELGFPTANMALHKSIPEGIYISQSKINVNNGAIEPLSHSSYPSLTFIGAARTFGQTELMAETYILDFNEDLYHQWLSIKLIKKLRDNKKFASAEALIEQMKLDEQEAREFFKKTP